MIRNFAHSVTFTRRQLCAGVAAVAAALVASPVLAAGNSTTRVAAWAIGSNLGFAGLLYAQGASDENVDTFLAKAKSIASSPEIGIEIKPFPPKEGEMPANMAVVMHYLIQGDGWSVGQQLSDKFDGDHGRLFEVAVKSSLLMVLYQPGDDMGIGGIIRDRCDALGLPAELWAPVTDAIDGKKDSETVRNAVLDMHQKMFDYLLKS